jgi:hypothetical protein
LLLVPIFFIEGVHTRSAQRRPPLLLLLLHAQKAPPPSGRPQTQLSGLDLIYHNASMLLETVCVYNVLAYTQPAKVIWVCCGFGHPFLAEKTNYMTMMMIIKVKTVPPTNKRGAFEENPCRQKLTCLLLCQR